MTQHVKGSGDNKMTQTHEQKHAATNDSYKKKNVTLSWRKQCISRPFMAILVEFRDVQLSQLGMIFYVDQHLG